MEWTDAGISEVISAIMDGATGTDAATGCAVRAHDGSARTLADGRRHDVRREWCEMEWTRRESKAIGEAEPASRAIVISRALHISLGAATKR